jgi:hypothetical protein
VFVKGQPTGMQLQWSNIDRIVSIKEVEHAGQAAKLVSGGGGRGSVLSRLVPIPSTGPVPGHLLCPFHGRL